MEDKPTTTDPAQHEPVDKRFVSIATLFVVGEAALVYGMFQVSSAHGLVTLGVTLLFAAFVIAISEG